MKLFGSLFTFITIRYVLGDWCLGAGYSLQWVSSRARVNQQPPMHQLAVLFTGWGAFLIWCQMGFIPIHFFSPLIIVFYLFLFVFYHFFSGPDLTHSYPTHLPIFISIELTDLVVILTTYPTDLATLLFNSPI
jgi:hypothetical protein